VFVEGGRLVFKESEIRRKFEGVAEYLLEAFDAVVFRDEVGEGVFTRTSVGRVVSIHVKSTEVDNVCQGFSVVRNENAFHFFRSDVPVKSFS